MKTVRTEEELASAMKSGEDTIVVEGDLANKTIKIKATGSIAWAIAFTALAFRVLWRRRAWQRRCLAGVSRLPR